MTGTGERHDLIQRPRPGSAAGPGPAAPAALEADLASRWLGSSVVAASDESFGDKENLLAPDAPAFEPGHYGNRGEIVDGWETRRRRDGGHDWVVVRLGTPGVIKSVDVDTSFFTGNHPESCSVEACGFEGYPGPAELTSPATPWVTIVPKSPLRGDEHNLFEASDPRRFTHVRLSTFPDGGIARLRVAGQVVPDPRGLEALTIDLAGQEYGGAVVASSDDFYAAASMLNRPGRARSMGEGWETRRRRDGGFDHVVFRLAFPGVIRRIVVDTAHFKYNASAEVALHGCLEDYVPPSDSPAWLPLLGRTRLQPDTRHEFASQCAQPVVMVRLDAIPDGGLSRVRLIGSIEANARCASGYRWFNLLPTAQAVQCLVEIGMSPELAIEIERQRPLNEGWLSSEQRHLADDSTTISYRAFASMIEGKTR
jgi:allantoicase